ncbi:hypothetical protein NC652_032842 [Populus alba x Populus x berolinensis]|nr:hypothetical protein NC652_032842 [Populus alba x Populus x berolinensis]
MIYKAMNPRTDKIVRRTTMVATAVASYFLLTADYGPQPNAVEPVGSCAKMNDVNAVDAISFKFLSIKNSFSTGFNFCPPSIHFVCECNIRSKNYEPCCVIYFVCGYGIMSMNYQKGHIISTKFCERVHLWIRERALRQKNRAYTRLFSVHAWEPPLCESGLMVTLAIHKMDGQ